MKERSCDLHHNHLPVISKLVLVILPYILLLLVRPKSEMLYGDFMACTITTVPQRRDCPHSRARAYATPTLICYTTGG